MGETGCGKTRLVKFMCDLWKPPGTEHLRNMVLVKVLVFISISYSQLRVVYVMYFS